MPCGGRSTLLTLQVTHLIPHASKAAAQSLLPRWYKAEMTVPWLKGGEMLGCEVPLGQYWHRCPERLENFLLGDVQQPPDMGLGTLLWVSLPEQRLGQMDPEVSSNLNHSVLHDNLIQETAAFPAEPCELFMSSKNYLLSTNLAWASCYFFPGWWQCTHFLEAYCRGITHISTHIEQCSNIKKCVMQRLICLAAHFQV